MLLKRIYSLAYTAWFIGSLELVYNTLQVALLSQRGCSGRMLQGLGVGVGTYSLGLEGPGLGIEG